MESVIPFSFFLNHVIVIAVSVNDNERKFIFDTGIGITVLTNVFAKSINAKTKGIYSGKRMSGQVISMPLAELRKIKVGPIERHEFTVGIFDTTGFPPELKEISGILSPDYFGDVIFTLDYENSEILLRENISKIEDLCEFVVPLDIDKTDNSISIYINAITPSKKKVRLELDSGSDILILNDRLMDEMGINTDDPHLKILKGVDETGEDYVRYITALHGKFAIAGAEEIFQLNPRVVFQDIVYDGLLGNDFLRSYKVTFDLKLGKVGFSHFGK